MQVPAYEHPACSRMTRKPETRRIQRSLAHLHFERAGLTWKPNAMFVFSAATPEPARSAADHRMRTSGEVDCRRIARPTCEFARQGTRGLTPRFEPRKTRAESCDQASPLASRQGGERLRFYSLGPRHTTIQDALTASSKFEPIDSGVCGMRGADEEAAVGEFRNRQTHVLRSHEGAAREIGGRKCGFHRQFGESLELKDREFHVGKRGSNFLFD